MFFFLGIIAFGLIIIFITIYNNLSKIRFKAGSSELKDRSDVPLYLQDLFHPFEEELIKLGFEFSHCQLNRRIFVTSYPDDWMLVYINRELSSYGTISLANPPEPSNPCAIEFITVFKDAHRLSTLNGLLHNIVGTIPNTTIQDLYTADLLTQWQAHTRKLSVMQALRPIVVLNVDEFVLNYSKSLQDYMNSLISSKWVNLVENNSYQLRLFPSIITCIQVMKSIFKYDNLKRKRFKLYQSKGSTTILPTELEIQKYYEQAERYNSNHSGKSRKYLLFILTLALCAVSFGYLKLLDILILLGVLMIHELGHFLGMYFSGIKDVKILFLPFLGAVTVGKYENIPPHRKVIMFLLGPVPGIILGVALLLYSMVYNHSDIIYRIALALLLINYFNLLPIMPFDGGQLLNLFFSRFPYVQIAIQIIGSLLILVLSQDFGFDKVLFSVAIFLFINSIMQVQNAALLSKLRQKIKTDKLELSEQVLLPEIFILLRHKKYTGLDSAKKYITVQYILSHITATHPSIKLITITMIFYVSLFLMPLMIIFGIGVYYSNSPLRLLSLAPSTAPQSGSSNHSNHLTTSEEKLAVDLAFDRNVLLAVKPLAEGEIQQLSGYDDQGNKIKVKGICVQCTKLPDQTMQILLHTIRQDKQLQGYLIFEAMNKGTGLIGIIDSQDQYEILRIFKTNGYNYDHSPNDIIAKLQTWEKKHPFTITGAGFDWVEIEFKEIPSDSIIVAEEAYSFCPDVIEQGTQSKEKLAEEIQKTRRLFLWWD